MLSPGDRTLLLENLRPPAGYELDIAVGTTYTLDLVALLRVPLAFAFFDWEDDAGRHVTDALALFEAIRTTADKMTIFCERGRISVPHEQMPLFSRLEDCVCEVPPPRPFSAFHPKVWVLCFVREGHTPLYRLLVASRNLTFDRSWDTLLTLDGTVGDRDENNEPLASFVEQIVATGKPSTAGGRRTAIIKLANDLRSVKWQRPPDFYAGPFFHHFGLRDSAGWSLFEGHKGRTLVMSPFVHAKALPRFGDPSSMVLVAREDELAAMSERLPEGMRTLYMPRDVASPDSLMSDSEEGDTLTEQKEAADSVASKDETLQGLHAKLFVLEDNRSNKVRILTGSANATVAGFERNVEFMVELHGNKTAHGIDAFLAGTPKQPGMQALLLPYEQPEEPVEQSPQQRLQDTVDSVHNELSATTLRGTCEPSGDGWLIELKGKAKAALDPRVKVTVRPVTVARAGAATIDIGDPKWNVTFGVSGIETITQFFAFELAATGAGGITARTEFVRRVDVRGLPEERNDEITRQILSRANIMRYLLYLASFDPNTQTRDAIAGSASALATASSEAHGVFSGYGPTLLEAMLKMLTDAPARLKRIDSLVKELDANPDTAKFLDDDFRAIWPAIREVWAADKSNGRGPKRKRATKGANRGDSQ